MKVYKAKKDFVLIVHEHANYVDEYENWCSCQENHSQYDIEKDQLIGKVPDKLPAANSAEERYNPGINFYPWGENTLDMYYGKLKVDDEVEIVEVDRDSGLYFEVEEDL